MSKGLLCPVEATDRSLAECREQVSAERHKDREVAGRGALCLGGAGPRWEWNWRRHPVQDPIPLCLA